MMELFLSINRYWGVFGGMAIGIVSVAFSIGRLWARVETSIRSASHLNEKVEGLEKFRGSQEYLNVNLTEGMMRNAKQWTEHCLDDAERLGRIEKRIDGIFELLTKK